MISADGASRQEVVDHRLTLSDGLSMHYRLYPGPEHARTPVLCLHGFWRNCRDFEELAPRLAGERTVVAPDCRGRGWSDYASTADAYRFEILVDDMWQLLDALHLPRVVVIGTALGGFMGIEMARQRPARVAGIVLNDVGPEIPSDFTSRVGGSGVADRLTLEEAVARVRSVNAANYPGLRDDDWVRLTLRAYARTPDGRYRRDYDALSEEATRELLGRPKFFWEALKHTSRTPIEALRAERSHFFPQSMADRMVREYPNVTLTIVNDRGHPPLYVEPEVTAAISRALGRADEAGQDSTQTAGIRCP